MKPDLLKGIRIIDFTTYVAAPGAGRIMADWGADVIKVEGLSGDPMRNFGVQMGIPATDDVTPFGSWRTATSAALPWTSRTQRAWRS